MSAGTLGQCTVLALVIAGLARLLWVHGFLRGFRHAGTRARDAETLNLLSRIEDGAVLTRPARAPYRTPKTPLSFPIVYDGRDHGEH